MAQVVASLTALIGADTKGFEAGAKRVKGGMNDLKRSITGVLPSSVSQFLTLTGAVTLVGTALKSTIDDTIKYANEVRQLSTLSGTSAESTSRFIQVIDDYKLSAEDAMLATKALTKEGLTPSIDTLANLSDQYLTLTTAQEKNEFVLKNLGKGGLKWVEILNKGSKAIKEQGAAVDKNLILNQKAVDSARKYELALDQLNDTIAGVKVSLGQELVPAAQAMLSVILADIEAVKTFDDVLSGSKSIDEWANGIIEVMPAFELFGVTIGNIKKDVPETTGALGENSDALDAQKEAVKAAGKALEDYRDQLDAVSQANQDAESFIQSYADFQKGYAEEHANALQDVTDAQEKLQEAYDKEAKTKSQKDSRLESIKDAKDGLLEAGEAVQKLEATWHESTQKMIYDMVLAKVSVDGLTDAEFKATQDLAVSMGIRSQADADAAKAAMDKATAIADGIAAQEDVSRDNANTQAELLRLEDAKAQASAQTTQTVVDGAVVEVDAMGQVKGSIDSATQSLVAMGYAASQTAGMMASMGGASKYNPQSVSATNFKSQNTSNAKHVGKASGRDTGGSGIAGESYKIGVEELFIPKTDGEFVPLHGAQNKIGNTYNIYITNPKKETAENSVRAALQNLSYLGVAN